MAAAHLAQEFQEEVTCAVCKDYFSQPVTLGCGHSFCRRCLLRSWAEVDRASSCPECRRVVPTGDLEPNHRLRKLASIARHLRPYLLRVPEERITCEKHKQEQVLFCEEDQCFLCTSCLQSGQHSGHTVRPANKAAETIRGKLRKASGLLWEGVETNQDMLTKERAKEEVWKQQAHAWRQSVESEYRRLLDFLKNEKRRHLDALASKEREHLQKFRENQDRLSQRLQHLRKEISNIEQNCKKTDIQLLRVAGDTSRRVKSLLSSHSYPEAARKPHYIAHITGMFEMMNTFRVNVTLDPDSASPYLIVSEDLKTVRNGGCPQNVPVSPDRFEDPVILGAQVFTSGTHYWEVHVGDSVQWSLGVCRDSVSRKSRVPLHHGDVFLITYRQDQDSGMLISSCCQIPSQAVYPMCRVGIFLDYNKGILSFYDVLKRCLIFSFPHLPFFSPLRPMFILWPPVRAELSVPMTMVHDPFPSHVSSQPHAF